MKKQTRHLLLEVFERLLRHFGPLHWWPAETPFEVCVGAILTQNTAWTNVEKAIDGLKNVEVLTPEAIRDVDVQQLAVLIRPSGFFNVKSQRLKVFVNWLFARFDGSLERMFEHDWQRLREELIAVKGIGPETCDSILLYAGAKPSFVVDSYTRRLFHRLGLLPQNAGYNETRDLFMGQLPSGTELFNEYHALIVEQCKQFCRKRPICHVCPLNGLCQFGK
ncbi:MAG TPA: endonuclease III domain-containing protein [Deltaproteobacteria bacterium]|nr:endonuclease III domain-containing protein [Deltaproteobacteria bacterium]HQB38658.1 endonuclease III domain-containing protein [Deltaproteobacteria bacterium]